MVKNVDGPAVRLVDDTEAALAAMPTELAVTLVDIAAACREGLMAVAVEAGLATAMAIMADEAAGLCGVWNARDPQRSHVRGGTTETSVVMGGQRLPIRRPRVRAADGSGEVPLASFGVFSQGDLLNVTVMERMLTFVADGFAQGSSDDWVVQIRGGIGALLTYLAENPVAARVGIVEGFGAGPRARDRYQQAVSSFFPFLDSARNMVDEPDRIPTQVARVIVGGVSALMFNEASNGRAADLPRKTARGSTRRPYRKPTQVGWCEDTKARERNLVKELGTTAP